MTGLRGRPASKPTRLRSSQTIAATPAQEALRDKIANGPRKQQASVVPVADEDGNLLGPFSVMLLTPEIGDAVQQVGAALRFGGRLPTVVRELAILTVAAERGAAFEWVAHEAAARAAGVTDAQLQAVLDGTPPPGLSGDEATAVGVARTLVAGRDLDDAGYEDAAGTLGPAALAELVWLVGYYDMLALALAVFRPPGVLSDQET